MLFLELQNSILGVTLVCWDPPSPALLLVAGHGNRRENSFSPHHKEILTWSKVRDGQDRGG